MKKNKSLGRKASLLSAAAFLSLFLILVVQVSPAQAAENILRSDNSTFFSNEGENWYAIQANNASSLTAPDSQYYAFGDMQIAGGDYYIARSVIVFNTAGLADNAVITGARVGMKVAGAAMGSQAVDIYLMGYKDSLPFDNTNYDFDLFENIYAQDFTDTWANDSWQWFYLSSAGIEQINKTGLTIFGFVNSYDYYEGALEPALPVYPDARKGGVYGTGVAANKIRLEVWYENENLPISWEYPTLYVTPDNGPSGTTVNLTGSGYTPNGAVKIHIRIPNHAPENIFGWFFYIWATADNSGNLDENFVITAGLPTGTLEQFYAVDENTGRESYVAEFLVTRGIRISVNPHEVNLNAQLIVQGENFTENGLVTLYIRGAEWDNWNTLVPVGIVTADNVGKFTTRFICDPHIFELHRSYLVLAVDNTTELHSNQPGFLVVGVVAPPPIDDDPTDILMTTVNLLFIVVLSAIGGVYFGLKGAALGCIAGTTISLMIGIIPVWIFSLMVFCIGGALFLVLIRRGG